MEIKELHGVSNVQFCELKELMKQLSSSCEFNEQQLQQVIDSKDCHLYVLLNNDVIVGCATLCLFFSPTGAKASIEDVVVDEKYRGQHLGKKLLEHVIHEARQFSPIKLQLTSRPTRVAANKLYQSLVFEKRETNCYKLDL